MRTTSPHTVSAILLSPTVRTLLFCLAIFLVGCSKRGPSVVVSGKVTIGDQGANGSIHFIGPSGKEVMGPLLNGKYEVSDPEVGENKIAVKGMAAATGATGAVKSPEIPGAPPSAGMGVSPPAKYATPEGSGLTYTVTKGKQTKDFPLAP